MTKETQLDSVRVKTLNPGPNRPKACVFSPRCFIGIVPSSNSSTLRAGFSSSRFEFQLSTTHKYRGHWTALRLSLHSRSLRRGGTHTQAQDLATPHHLPHSQYFPICIQRSWKLWASWRPGPSGAHGRDLTPRKFDFGPWQSQRRWNRQTLRCLLPRTQREHRNQTLTLKRVPIWLRSQAPPSLVAETMEAS